MPENKASIVKMAFVYAQEGNWYKAIEEYKKLLALEPDDPHVLNQVGDAFMKKNDLSDALEYFLKSRELYLRQGNAAKVSALDRKIAKIPTDNVDLKTRHLLQSIANSQEAEGIASEGKAEEAVAYYHQLIGKEPANLSYREKLISFHLEHAQVAEAVAQLKAVADLHLSVGKIDEAKAVADRIAQLDPDGLDTARLSASFAKQKGEAEEIARLYGKLAQLASQAGFHQEASEAIETAQQAGNTSLKLVQAKTLLALRRTPEAKKLFEELLRESPQDDVLLEQMVGLSEEARDWAAAYTHLAELLKRRTGDSQLLSRMARALVQTGRRPEAVKIYIGLAVETLKQNRPEAALSYFNSILALDPENLEVLKKKAEIHLKMGQRQECVDVYKKLAQVFTQKKMPEEAKKATLILQKLSAAK